MTTHAFLVRLANPGDLPDLPGIERQAGLMFKAYRAELGLADDVFDEATAVEDLEAGRGAGCLWVASTSFGQLVGFALVVHIDGHAHLDELSVLPTYGRQGIGSALLRAVCAWAAEQGHRAVTLRTFRDVPWNAPFYLRRGFRIVESRELPAAYDALERHEQEQGLRTDLRVTMVYDIEATLHP
jgi:GNAT superfamily N-acetyltransferase